MRNKFNSIGGNQIMGDRGNIVVMQSKNPSDAVWLYTHWGGSDLNTILANALLRGKDRLDDPSYLTRIIFCELIGDDIAGTTGFGISTRMDDNEYDVLLVNPFASVVYIFGEDSVGKDGKFSKDLDAAKSKNSYTFQEFCDEFADKD